MRGSASGAGNGDTGTNYGEGSVNFGMEGTATGNAWNNTIICPRVTVSCSTCRTSQSPVVFTNTT
ncbi:MAG: hypothetical protein RID25_26950, partial [Cyclobacteriaceae bacterium]